MSPEETLPMFNPQIIAIDNRSLNDQEFPPVSINLVEVILIYSLKA